MAKVKKPAKAAGKKPKDIREAEACQREILAVLERRGFQLKARPVMKEASPGCWVTTAEVYTVQVQKS